MIPFGFLGRSGFDPATLSLTGWWRASYSGSPWTPTASAGSSGSNGNFAEATNAPATGSAVNGLTPADFDGTNDILGNSNTIDTFVNASAGTVIALINADTVAADTFVYDNETVFGLVGAGHVIFGVSSAGLRCAIHDGGYKEPTAVAFSTGTWVMGMMRWNGSNLEQSINAGSVNSVAAGNVASLTASPQLGTNYAAAAFFDGKILEVMTASSYLSDADLTNIKSYFNARYGLSL